MIEIVIFPRRNIKISPLYNDFFNFFLSISRECPNDLNSDQTELPKLMNQQQMHHEHQLLYNRRIQLAFFDFSQSTSIDLSQISIGPVFDEHDDRYDINLCSFLLYKPIRNRLKFFTCMWKYDQVQCLKTPILSFY